MGREGNGHRDGAGEEGDHVVHSHPVPPEQLARYSPERDPHSERDIANYVHGQAPDEEVQHVEKVKEEVVLDDAYDIWDVTTDRDRWWVITNMTNLYSQRHFPSLDYTLSFHIGLMARLRSRQEGASVEDPTPFDEVLRRMDQARSRHERAQEAEDFQAVGVQLRECLISLVIALRRRVKIREELGRPKDGDFVGWMDVLVNELCGGGSNKSLRRHLKKTGESTWQLVNWLTHDRTANRAASLIALHACHTLLGHAMLVLRRSRIDATEECMQCGSRDVRTHFDLAIEPDGDYYLSCGSCGWTTHPG